jgi:hypothetical protein
MLKKILHGRFILLKLQGGRKPNSYPLLSNRKLYISNENEILFLYYLFFLLTWINLTANRVSMVMGFKGSIKSLLYDLKIKLFIQ